MISRACEKLLPWINYLFYPKVIKTNCAHLRQLTLLQRGIIQRVVGINRKVPWPVHWTSKIVAPQRIVPGNRAPGGSICTYLDGRNGIIFEENVRLGPRVSIISMNHNTDDYDKYEKAGSIRIGKNSWLASNSTILANVELGEHTIVAAGAIVTRSYPEGNQLLAGNPARVIRKLQPYHGK